ncbi:MAG TPA: PQQ-binding-like beta-propeller repeat protein [Actinophytocola sp.]|uniref:outer membrane protein assembly factor BamB family protein n=1 Tax=Actinophytocola sp. TaxID=1872138 RepID=UPI002E06B80E|nr:PQQ-binding-like beta-propeller repeat protein [Actinophytocola sp.]
MRKSGALAFTLLVLTACAANGSAPGATGSSSAVPPSTATGSSSAPAPATTESDWPTYHRDNARTGVAAGLAPLGTLGVAWRAALDGAVYGQPLVVGNRILAATEHNTIYSLDPSTGAVQWSAHVGEPVPRSALPCGNIDPLGITGTMVFDPATSRVFALAETTSGAHLLVGVNVTSGAVEVRVPLEPPEGDRLAHQQRAALTLLGNRVYVAYGGLFGDCGRYFGSVVSVTTAGAEPLSYHVPTPREAGIWATGGAVVDGDRLLVSAGNGESTSGFDDSDSVLALSPTLARVDLFAPSTWADDNRRDLDLGSSSPILLGDFVLIIGKRGTGYVLRRTALGGVGGQVASAEICRSFGGSAVNAGVAYVPCADGTRAVRLDASGVPTVVWRTPVRANGSPTVGGGAVWVTDYSAGLLYALDPATGAVRAQLTTGTLPHFASPTLSGDHAYLGTMDGVLAISGA